MNDLPPKQCDIAMVFQNYALYPHRTVGENMGFSPRLRGAPKTESKARVRPAAEILGYCHSLIGIRGNSLAGRRQRVAMGRAIVGDPQVFLFDEPLSNLEGRRELLPAKSRSLSRLTWPSKQKETLA